MAIHYSKVLYWTRSKAHCAWNATMWNALRVCSHPPGILWVQCSRITAKAGQSPCPCTQESSRRIAPSDRLRACYVVRVDPRVAWRAACAVPKRAHACWHVNVVTRGLSCQCHCIHTVPYHPMATANITCTCTLITNNPPLLSNPASRQRACACSEDTRLRLNCYITTMCHVSCGALFEVSL